MSRARLAHVIAVIAALMLTGTTAVRAQSPIIVTTNADDGPGSLRQALASAAVAGGPVTIQFDPDVTGTITLLTGQLVVSGHVTIQGPGAKGLTIDGNGSATHSRVFLIPYGSTVAISGLTIANGSLNSVANSQSGGGIKNDGTLQLSDCTISANFASGLDVGGGGIYSTGTLTVTDTTISNNTASGVGGGGILSIGSTTITRSTIENNISGFSTNFAHSGGGGIFADGLQEGCMLTITDSLIADNEEATGGAGLYISGCTVTMTGSTVTGNFSDEAPPGGAGGIENHGTVTLVNSTVSNNQGTKGGGIWNVGVMNLYNVTLAENEGGVGGNLFNDSQAILTVKNTVSANSISGGDCVSFGTLNNDGFVNFSTDNCGIAWMTVPSTGPGGINLGALQDNGGPTPTHALLEGSVAIDTVTVCNGPDGNPLTVDQRGTSRPQGVACDAGAFEKSVAAPPPAPLLTSTPSNPTNVTTAIFKFSDTDQSATFACSLDGAPAVACTSGVTYTVGDGGHTFAVAAVNAAGASTPAAFTWTVDTIPPSITITTPGSGASYWLHAAVDASYACDGTGSAVQACAGPVANGAPIDTSTVGTHQFTVNATDAAGNSASAPVAYTVLYQFNGFSAPLSNPPIFNSVNAGASVPLKWVVEDGLGQPVTTLTSVQITATEVACSAAALSVSVASAGTTTAEALQNFGGGAYQFNWHTPKSLAGSCKALALDLGDGAQHQALFVFK